MANTGLARECHETETRRRQRAASRQRAAALKLAIRAGAAPQGRPRVGALRRDDRLTVPRQICPLRMPAGFQARLFQRVEFIRHEFRSCHLDHDDNSDAPLSWNECYQEQKGHRKLSDWRIFDEPL